MVVGVCGGVGAWSGDIALLSQVIRGGIRQGKCADLSMKGVKPVEAFIVFIISKRTFGNAFTQPV